MNETACDIIAQHLDIEMLQHVESIDSICAFSGAKIKVGIPKKKIIKETFTDHQYLKYVSDYVGINVAATMSKVIDGQKGKVSLRNYSFIANNERLVLLKKSDIMKYIVSPLKAPFVFCVSFNNKKHLAFKAKPNYCRDEYIITTDLGDCAIARKKVKNKNQQADLFSPEEYKPSESMKFSKHFDNVPFVAGNSIRGLMRRLAMRDFCKLAGIDKLEKTIYHQLFTGGTITDSTGFEDIEKREEYIKMCPMIGLFGSAIGNMTIQGELKVGGARLRCKENGTGSKSYWELTQLSFGTRLDSSKTEKDLEITAVQGGEKNQMKYEYEVFIKGAKFDSVFAVTTDDELIVSAFWHAVKLLKDFGYILGNSARDSGMVDIDIEIKKTANKKYLEYIEENKSKIKSYFSAKDFL
jgi:hypothetical protein